jgi:hypothetical protein
VVARLEVVVHVPNFAFSNGKLLPPPPPLLLLLVPTLQVNRPALRVTLLTSPHLQQQSACTSTQALRQARSGMKYEEQHSTP